MSGVANTRVAAQPCRRARAVLLAALGVAMLATEPAEWTAPPPARAQTSPRVTVPSAIAAEPASQAPLAIRVDPTDAIPRNSFLRLRGLPPTAALSEGYSIAPGTWAVPLAALPDLKIMLPAGASGRAQIVVSLVAIDGAVLAEASTALSISAASRAERAEAPRRAPAPTTIMRAGVPEGAERSAPPPVPVTRPSHPEERERALRLMKRGDEQMAEGNVAAARLFYERAADAGLAQGAMALAATYDSVELAKLQVRGIPPDVKQARRWYERAKQLGAGDADARLARLGGG